jgi:small-conductance mechanosensitive channel
MNTAINWLETEWRVILIPIVVFWVTLILTFWLRKLIYDYLRKLVPLDKWKANEKVIEAVRGPSALWCLFLGIFLALYSSSLPGDWKPTVSRIMWTILLISLTVPLLRISGEAVMFYGKTLRMVRKAAILSRNVVRVVILILATLVALEIWGVSTNIILVLLVTAVVAMALGFRDAFPNFFAGINIGAKQQVKKGDFIKLEGGEEGYITRIGWNNTLLQTPEDHIVIVPNNFLLQRTVVNFGRPLKKAREAFQFNIRKTAKVPTGERAKNLYELVQQLTTAPDDVFFCHTFRCLEENPDSAWRNHDDFSTWAKDVLGLTLLSEKLNRIKIFEYTNLAALRENYINVIGEFIRSGQDMRDAPTGKEFYFIKATSTISPTSYLAHDLREFAETLRKVSPDSLYFHILGSRLRLRNGMNDFSVWLENSVGESELSREINMIDPYAYNSDGLRSLLIQSIEKRIK